MNVLQKQVPARSPRLTSAVKVQLAIHKRQLTFCKLRCNTSNNQIDLRIRPETQTVQIPCLFEVFRCLLKIFDIFIAYRQSKLGIRVIRINSLCSFVLRNGLSPIPFIEAAIRFIDGTLPLPHLLI